MIDCSLNDRGLILGEGFRGMLELVLTDCASRLIDTGVKRPGREADYAFPSSFEVKNAWNSACTLYTFLWHDALAHNSFTLCITRM